MAIDIWCNFYKKSQSKYEVSVDSIIYSAYYIGQPSFRLEKRGILKKGRIVYRTVSVVKSKYLPNYHYVDTDYLHRGTLQGYVRKENLKKLEKEK